MSLHFDLDVGVVLDPPDAGPGDHTGEQDENATTDPARAGAATIWTSALAHRNYGSGRVRKWSRTLVDQGSGQAEHKSKSIFTCRFPIWFFHPKELK